MTSVRKMDGARSWVYLVTVGLVLSLAEGGVASFGIFVVVLSEYFNETNRKIGWVGATAYCILCVAYPIAVYLQSRYGFRAVVSFAALLFSLAHITTPFVPSANYLFLTYSLPIGLSISIIDCLSITTLREYFDKYLSLVTGMRFAFVMIGAICSSYLLPVFIDAIGWKKTSWYLSSVGVVILVYAFTYQITPLNEEKRTTVLMTDGEDDSEKSEKPRRLLRNKKFLLLCCGCFLQSFTFLISPMFMVQYATTLGYPLSKAKYLLLVYSTGSLVGRLTGGVLSDLLSKKWNIFYSVGVNFSIYALSSALVTFTTNLWLLIVYMGIIGYLEGWFYVMGLMMMKDVTSGINMDYAYSFSVIFMGIGYLTGPPTMGWLYDVTGDYRLVLYSVAACIMFAGVLMIAGRTVIRRDEVNDTTDCDKILQEKYALMKETLV